MGQSGNSYQWGEFEVEILTDEMDSSRYKSRYFLYRLAGLTGGKIRIFKESPQDDKEWASAAMAESAAIHAACGLIERTSGSHNLRSTMRLMRAWKSPDPLFVGNS